MISRHLKSASLALSSLPSANKFFYQSVEACPVIQYKVSVVFRVINVGIVQLSPVEVVHHVVEHDICIHKHLALILISNWQ